MPIFPTLLPQCVSRGFGILLILLVLSPSTVFANYLQLDAVVGVKTRFSSGCSTIEEVAEIARQRSVDVVLYTDLIRNSLEYGITPFERIFRKKEEMASILTSSATGYLSEIQTVNSKIPDVLLIPGMEANPFYYWTGSVFKDDLVAHDFEKRLWAFGLETPSDYEHTPILNSNFSKKVSGSVSPWFAGGLAFFLASIFMVVRDIYRKLSAGLAVVFLLITFNYHPFQSSPFDQYHGSQGIYPYQKWIDHVNSAGGLTFWAGVSAPNGMRKMGSIQLETMPYPEDLVLSKNATGFESISFDASAQINSGMEWDHILREYTIDKREKPLWGLGGNPITCDGENGQTLGQTRTIILARERSQQAILDAMKAGRMYAVRQVDENRLSLDDFKLLDRNTGRIATLGEELALEDYPELRGSIRSLKGGEKSAIVTIIRNGTIIKEETVPLPYQFSWQDKEVEKRGRSYYRVNVSVGDTEYLGSNPIFVRFGTLEEHVARLKESAMNNPGTANPQRPDISEPNAPRVSAPQGVSSTMRPEMRKNEDNFQIPQVSRPSVRSPSTPGLSGPDDVTTQYTGGSGFVTPRTDGLAIKKGPGTIFPDAMTVNRNDRLQVVRTASVTLDNKPWLIVRVDGKLGYVWSGLVKKVE